MLTRFDWQRQTCKRLYFYFLDRLKLKVLDLLVLLSSGGVHSALLAASSDLVGETAPKTRLPAYLFGMRSLVFDSTERMQKQSNATNAVRKTATTKTQIQSVFLSATICMSQMMVFGDLFDSLVHTPDAEQLPFLQSLQSGMHVFPSGFLT